MNYSRLTIRKRKDQQRELLRKTSINKGRTVRVSENNRGEI